MISQAMILQGLCYSGAVDDECISWNTLKENAPENYEYDIEDSVEDIYKPAFRSLIAAIVICGFCSLFCLLYLIYPMTKVTVVQAIVFLCSAAAVVLTGITLYQTSSTFLTKPHHHDDCHDASSSGLSGYNACAIGVAVTVCVTVVSVYPFLYGFKAMIYQILPS